MSAATRWWWVRHAPVVDHGGRIYGQSDVSCDTSDEPRFRSLAAALPRRAVWVTSHLKRTRDTAAALGAAGLEIGDPLVEPGLAEQDFGDWQGLSWQQLQTTDNRAYREFWKEPGVKAPPGGESFADVIGRVEEVVGRLTGEHSGSDIVAVAHGGTIRAALAIALGLTPERALSIKTGNLSLTRLDHVADGSWGGESGGVWRVAGVNLEP